MADPVTSGQITPVETAAIAGTVGLLSQMGATLEQIARNPLATGIAADLLGGRLEKLATAWKKMREEQDGTEKSTLKIIQTYAASGKTMLTYGGVLIGVALKLREIRDRSEELQVSMLRMGRVAPGGRMPVNDAFDIMYKQADIMVRYGKTFSDVWNKTFQSMGEGLQASGMNANELERAVTTITKYSLAMGADVSPILNGFIDDYKSMGMNIDDATGYLDKMYETIISGSSSVRDTRKAIQDITAYASSLERMGYGPQSMSKAVQLYGALTTAGFGQNQANQVLGAAGNMGQFGAQGANARMQFQAAIVGAGGRTGIGLEHMTPEELVPKMIEAIRSVPGTSFEDVERKGGMSLTTFLQSGGITPELFASAKGKGVDMTKLTEALTTIVKAEKIGVGTGGKGISTMEDTFSKMGTWSDVMKGAVDKFGVWVEKLGGGAVKDVLAVGGTGLEIAAVTKILRGGPGLLGGPGGATLAGGASKLAMGGVGASGAVVAAGVEVVTGAVTGWDRTVRGLKESGDEIRRQTGFWNFNRLLPELEAAGALPRMAGASISEGAQAVYHFVFGDQTPGKYEARQADATQQNVTKLNMAEKQGR